MPALHCRNQLPTSTRCHTLPLTRAWATDHATLTGLARYHPPTLLCPAPRCAAGVHPASLSRRARTGPHLFTATIGAIAVPTQGLIDAMPQSIAQAQPLLAFRVRKTWAQAPRLKEA